MKIIVRSAVRTDLPALLALYSELNPDDAPLPQEKADATWATISGQHGRTVLVAEAEGVVVGTADCLVMPNLTRGGRAILFVENVVHTFYASCGFQRRAEGFRHYIER
ncbi:GNAT family N-acetyltransferase [Streptomyces sp. NPDC090112]|uniref:GNAT family N-acetyltransferase n=1 Tax=Streptomyces sp. NPDC090112 TaxID=3365949 RepID=UPI00381EBB15